MDLKVLLELQAIDTHLNQLEHKRSALPERKALQLLQGQIAEHERLIAQLDAGIAQLESAFAEAEKHGNDCDAKRQRLEAQLRTVIAPREAESLQREIESLRQEREEADGTGLDLMEQLGEQETTRDKARNALTELQREKPGKETALRDADAQIDEEMRGDRQRRDAIAETAKDVLAEYESRRKHLGGVAVSALVGRTCSGCHLDLSAGELQQLKDLGGSVDPECPNCGRWLVL